MPQVSILGDLEFTLPRVCYRQRAYFHDRELLYSSKLFIGASHHSPDTGLYDVFHVRAALADALRGMQTAVHRQHVASRRSTRMCASEACGRWLERSQSDGDIICVRV